MALFHNNAGLVYYAQGEYQRALEVFQEALRLCEATGTTWYQPETRSMLALTHLALDCLQEALEWATQALEIAQALGSQVYRGFAHRAPGEVHTALEGGHEQARRHFERSIALLEEAGARFDLALACRAYGRALHRWGQPEEGERYLRRARELFAAMGCSPAWLKDKVG